MISITKQQLASLSPHYGEIDTDSGQVLVTFAGQLDLSDGRYRGEFLTRPPQGEEAETLGQFDLASILESKGPTSGDTYEALDG